MNNGAWIISLVLLIIGEAVWIYRLTKNYHRLLEALSRASAKVAQHRILIADLQCLIEDDADLDRCLEAEIDGKAYARAREVEYEQNVKRWDAENPEIPWVPKDNCK